MKHVVVDMGGAGVKVVTGESEKVSTQKDKESED